MIKTKISASSHLIGVANVDRRKGELLQRGHGRLDGRHCRATRILQIIFSLGYVNQKKDLGFPTFSKVPIGFGELVGAQLVTLFYSPNF